LISSWGSALTAFSTGIFVVAMVFNFVLPSRKLVGVKSCVVVGFTLPRFFSVVSLVPSFSSFLRMLSLKFLFNDASSFKYQANLVS
jgi:hypothetical protein